MLLGSMGFLLRARVYFAAFVGLGAVLGTGCATAPKGPLTREAQLAHPASIKLELVENKAGLLVVEGMMSDGKPARFVIDTGATLTSIYPDLHLRLGLEVETKSAIRVHGMSSKKLLPATQISEMMFDGKALPANRVVIIPRDGGEGGEKVNASAPDGILGMDILKRYHLFLSRSQNLVYLIPTSLGAPSLPRRWDTVVLEGNPFIDDGRDLHFFQLHFGDGLTPALLDTGSEFNMVNWNVKRFPELRVIKKKLRKEWEILGAVGNFRPLTKITASRNGAGEKIWDQSVFLVLDFDSLDILGIEDKPFVISGLPMLSENDVLIDFESDRLYFSPDERKPQEAAN